MAGRFDGGLRWAERAYRAAPWFLPGVGVPAALLKRLGDTDRAETFGIFPMLAGAALHAPNVDQQDLIATAGSDFSTKGKRPDGTKVLSSDDLSPMFGIEMAPATPPKRPANSAVSRPPPPAVTVAVSSQQKGGDLAAEVDDNCGNEGRSGNG